MEFIIGGIILTFGLLVGILIGIFVGTERMRKAVEDCSVGHLRIDRSEPDEAPRPFLELTGATVESVSQSKFIVLKVINENYISQK